MHQLQLRHLDRSPTYQIRPFSYGQARIQNYYVIKYIGYTGTWIYLTFNVFIFIFLLPILLITLSLWWCTFYPCLNRCILSLATLNNICKIHSFITHSFVILSISVFLRAFGKNRGVIYPLTALSYDTGSWLRVSYCDFTVQRVSLCHLQVDHR